MHASKEPRSPADSQTILLTGATGYIGGRLLRELESEGASVRCLSRRPEVLEGRVHAQTRIVAGDVLAPETLGEALAGVSLAYYLVHSMGAAGDFRELDRAAARNFGDAARKAGVSLIVYLGGLGHGDDLSSHLASRQEVGEILRSSGVPTVELRASIVVGSGSASYETVRALVERLPVIVAPSWVETLAQPIAVEDAVSYLVDAGRLQTGSAVFEIGGSDRLTYAEIMREYARQRQLRRTVVRLPLSASASRLLLGLFTPVYGRFAAAMVGSLRNETIVRSDAAERSFSVQPRGLGAAIARALVNEDNEFAQTRWSDALPTAGEPQWGGVAVGRRRVTSRAIEVRCEASAAFAPVQRIGGESGWYSGAWFWRVRGLIDNLRGGVGLRRGRRDQLDLRVGDTVDFWRVERFEPGRLLRLHAEMRIPGRLWLQFEVDPVQDGATIRQTTVFDPQGFLGTAYWYMLFPVHRAVFRSMLRGIRRNVGGSPVENL